MTSAPGSSAPSGTVLSNAPGDDVPALELLLEQLGDLDGLGAVDDPPAAARRGEVVERQAGAAQLELERREPLGRRLAGGAPSSRG